MEEKGLDVCGVVEGAGNGFAEAVAGAFAPNSVSPILKAGCWEAVPFVFALADAGWPATFVCRTARRALMLPSFLLHGFRLHPSTYSLLSCPGKRSGKSPFNCKSKLRTPLQTLHLARIPDGSLLFSSHVCPTLSKRTLRHFNCWRTGRPPSWLKSSPVGSFEA